VEESAFKRSLADAEIAGIGKIRNAISLFLLQQPFDPWEFYNTVAFEFSFLKKKRDSIVGIS